MVDRLASRNRVANEQAFILVATVWALLDFEHLKFLEHLEAVPTLNQHHHITRP